MLEGPHPCSTLGAASEKIEQTPASVSFHDISKISNGVVLPDPCSMDALIGGLDFRAFRRRQAGAHQSDAVLSHNESLAIGDAKWRNVLSNSRQDSNERQFPDPHELMNRCIAGNDGAIADADMPAEQRAADERHAVAKNAIMSDVTVGHQQAAIANDGFRALGGPAVNRGPFSDNSAFADSAIADSAAKLVILGHIPDDGVRMHAATPAQDGMPDHDGRGSQVAFRADGNGTIDHNARPYRRGGINVSGGIDNCGGMYRHGRHAIVPEGMSAVNRKYRDGASTFIGNGPNGRLLKMTLKKMPDHLTYILFH